VAWRDPVIDYCERQGHGFWSEPVNALTNIAFLLAAAAAFALWRRRRETDHPALALIVVTALVGVGSFIFHTVATRGAMLFDVVPIAVFIYGYFLLALRRFFCLGAFVSTAITLLFAAASYFVENTFHGLHGSVSYLPALGAMICFAALLWPRTRRRQTAAGFRGVAELSHDGRRRLRWLSARNAFFVAYSERLRAVAFAADGDAPCGA
jgi:hypothetical protein